MKEWSDFENQDVANLLSGISYTVNRLKNKLSKKDYEALAGDVILLKINYYLEIDIVDMKMLVI